MVAEYNKVATVSTIVDDAEVEKVSSAIADASFYRKRWRWNYSRIKCRQCSKYCFKKEGSEAL